MKKFKFNLFFVLIIIINILLLTLRITAGDFLLFKGNFFSTILSIMIILILLILFILKKYDYFILMWISFYFASPILILTFSPIGLLGILNGIFMPLMIYKIFNLKNKYFIIITLTFLLGIMNLADTSIRAIFSNLFLFLTPFIFFYFVLKKCENPKLIMWGSALIALINVPLGIYEIIVQPVWGVLSDWRGLRIFGNVFWHNSYSFYLLPSILTLYAFFRMNRKKLFLVLMIILVLMDVFTFSRTGLISLLLSLTVFEYLYRSGFKLTKKKIIIVSCFLLILLLYLVIYPTLGFHLKPETIVERTYIWDSITPFIAGNIIFGNGLGSYGIYMDKFPDVLTLTTHNYYLNVIFELGLIGLFLFIMFLFFIFKDLKVKLHDTRKSLRSDELGIALLAGLLVFSFVGNAAFTQWVSLNTWIVLACCLKYNENIQAKKTALEK